MTLADTARPEKKSNGKKVQRKKSPTEKKSNGKKVQRKKSPTEKKSNGKKVQSLDTSNFNTYQ